MKKIVKLALIAAVAIPSVTFVGCKKGENDPAISLRSRKGRVAGEWTVASGEGKTTSGSSTTTWKIDGTTYSYTSGSTTLTSTYEGKYTFEKDGTWTSTTTQSGDGWSEKTDASGTWNFTGGVGETKNKSQIVMMTLSETTTSTFGSTTDTETDTWTGLDAPTSIYDIDQLKNKEMIWKMNGSSTYGSSTSSSEGTWTLTQE